MNTQRSIDSAQCAKLLWQNREVLFDQGLCDSAARVWARADVKGLRGLIRAAQKAEAGPSATPLRDGPRAALASAMDGLSREERVSLAEYIKADPDGAARIILGEDADAAPIAARVSARGLQGKELEDLRRAMGTHGTNTSSSRAHDAPGKFVLPSMTPTEMRARKAKAESGGRTGTGILQRMGG